MANLTVTKICRMIDSLVTGHASMCFPVRIGHCPPVKGVKLMRRSTGIGTVLCTTALGALFVATPAEAAGPGAARVSGADVVYTAGKDAKNRVVVTRSGNAVTVDDRVPVRAGAGCTAVRGDHTRVVC